MKKILIGMAIFVLAFFFRFNNLNWDENFHLHPDERFLTMVGTSMNLPTSSKQYFDQRTSLMNPENVGYKFFVYGRFPLMMTKYLAVVSGLDNYNDLTLLGRQLSAFFDLLIVILIIKTVRVLQKHYSDLGFRIPDLSLWAGFFYAIAVLPIQLSHFFAVDTFLNFFMFASFYFALRKKNILSAIFFGLALACKVTALFILPLNLFFIFKSIFKNKINFKFFVSSFIYLIIYLFVSYLTLRLADPYYFNNPSFLDPTLSKSFIENINSLKNMTVKSMENWFPPMVQWLNKNTVVHSVVNNFVFGLGLPYAILMIFGIYRIIFNFLRQLADSIFNQFLNSKSKFLNKKNKINNGTMEPWSNFNLIIIFLWVLCFFIYQSLQVTPTLRYFIIIYPFIAIFAAVGINYLIDFAIKLKSRKLRYPAIFSYVFIFISVLMLLLWPVMFSSIYSNKNSRVAASEWIYKNLPDGSYILSEAWDDSMPLPVINNFEKQFGGEQLPVFDPDLPDKWQKINSSLDKADYYILSSNRGWGSIMDFPEKYPLMSDFYKNLLKNKNIQYRKIKEFSSYPKFSVFSFQFSMNDQWSDEGFTVYDHPLVLIYKNERHPGKSF